jgi:RES domain
MTFGHIERGGAYYRVAEQGWADPLDGMPGVVKGGRWNPPGSFPVVYLNESVQLARKFVAHKLRGHPYGPEDLELTAGPALAATNVPSELRVDVVTDSGCRQAGLPSTYPTTSKGNVIPHETCWPIGNEAWRIGESGIACRSATTGATTSEEELAWFQRERQLPKGEVLLFGDWFFPKT